MSVRAVVLTVTAANFGNPGDVWGTRYGGAVRVPERARKFVNVLLSLVAVAGIGWSGLEIWQVLYGRYQINEACAGLVPAGRVLALSPAGGSISHRVAAEGTIELNAGLPQDCEIFSTEAGRSTAPAAASAGSSRARWASCPATKPSSPTIRYPASSTRTPTTPTPPSRSAAA